MELIELASKYQLSAYEINLLQEHFYSLSKTGKTPFQKKINNLLSLHTPVEYIVGEAMFYGNKFKVTRDTLIPRIETEKLVDLAVKRLKKLLKNHEKINIIDVGTGSGNIIISVARTLSSKQAKLAFYATDISAEAINIAQINAKNLIPKTEINFYQGNLIKPLTKNLINVPTLIIANLPYVPYRYKSDLATETIKHEPLRAILSEKGTKHYSILFDQEKELKIDTLSILIEFDHRMLPQVKELIKRKLPQYTLRFFQDQFNKTRFSLTQRP
jgi:release factor glutamine methyltransferase